MRIVIFFFNGGRAGLRESGGHVELLWVPIFLLSFVTLSGLSGNGNSSPERLCRISSRSVIRTGILTARLRSGSATAARRTGGISVKHRPSLISFFRSASSFAFQCVVRREAWERSSEGKRKKEKGRQLTK